MHLTTVSAAETQKLGARIGAQCRANDVVCLYGDLGAGKTVFARGIAQGLGIDPREVISPTFVLIRQYAKGRIPMVHVDCYRCSAPMHIAAIGYEEYLEAGAVSVIEWPQRFGELLPREHLAVHLCIGRGTKRTVSFTAHGASYARFLKGPGK
jgi:tRNA threonylcarbamoyladenosine biosynthesis protein TsaE